MRTRRGYTLLEMVVTMVILALVCMSTATLLSTSRRLGATASRHVRAHQLAEAVLEELSNLPMTGNDMTLERLSASPGDWKPTLSIPEPFGVPPGGIAVTRIPSDPGLAPTLMNLSVTVAWTETNGASKVDRRVRLARLVSGNVLR